MSRRIFTMVEGTSNKFWAITLDGASHTVEFGRVGTAGQSNRKEFGSDAEAKTSHDKLIAEKLRKGYSESTGEAETASASSTAATPAKSAKPKAKPAAEESGSTAAAEATSTATIASASAEVAKSQASSVAEEPEPVAKPASAPVADLGTLEMPARSMDLEPADWAWVSWKPFEPVAPPTPKPFDVKDALARLKKVASSDKVYNWNWNYAKFPAYPSDEEERFWLTVFFQSGNLDVPREYYSRVASQKDLGTRVVPIADLRKSLLPLVRFHSPEIGAMIFRAYSLDDYLHTWSKAPGKQDYGGSQAYHVIFNGFRRFVRPHLGAGQIAEMREKVRALLDPAVVPPDSYEAFPITWYLAASLGENEEIAKLLPKIPDTQYVGKDNYVAHYHRPQWLVLGLGDPVRIEAEWRRLKLTHGSPDEVRAWLATTGFSGLDVVRDSILGTSKKDEAVELTEALALAKAPEVAPVMLDLLSRSKGPKPAREWLDGNPLHAIAGLIETAGGRGKLADDAIAFLREQKKKGYGPFVEQCLANAPADAAQKIRREVLAREEIVVEPLDDASTPEALRSALSASAKLKPPTWVVAEDLPRILIGDRSMTAEQTSLLLAGLVKSTLSEVQPIVNAVREHGERSSLDAFAWALFERWLRDGAASKEKWAMIAVGLLGSDGAALKLTPLIRAWPGESQHPRAVLGLECLRAIGTDGAMMQLNGIAQKLPFKGLKNKAAEMMEAIARDRKMTRAQLEDRIVPDCDLDERGSRVFDFGPRQFTFVLGPEMKPMVRDAEGKLKPDLPKPGTKDDAALATAATEAWKLLKKQIREVGKIQAERLEQAMVVGRRWTIHDFETLLVKHPLMTNIVRLVLWGGYDASGKLVSTFRVTEERDYADSAEKSVTLDGLASAGIVHPLHLTPAEASAWGEIFGDYEIIPPFPQLGRPVYRLEPGKEAANNLSDQVPGKIPAVSLVGILERDGWARGIPEDAGIFHEHVKAFEGAGVTAVIQYDGVPVGYMVDWDDQEILSCFFIPGIYTPEMYPDHRKSIPLGRVDAVVLSEVLGTLGILASKVK